jgi:YVTN family beta-propeller protein
VVDDRAFVSNWFSGNKIFIVNTVTDAVTDSVEVGAEPESMIVDKNKKLWILCNGGYAREHFAGLIALDPATGTVIKRLTFPDIKDSPVCLQIDGAGEVLYYLDKGVRKMNINDTDLPAVPFISESTHLFYKMAVNEKNGDIFVTDAVDYQSKGYLLRYNKEGALLNTFTTEIIPGAMCFK